MERREGEKKKEMRLRSENDDLKSENEYKEGGKFDILEVIKGKDIREEM